MTITHYYEQHIIEQQKRDENTEWFTVLEQALQSTATRTSDEMMNRSGQGVILVVKIANEAGTCSFTPSITTKDDAGNTITLATFTALTADGTAIYWIHPHGDKPTASKAAFTEVASLSLPRVWKLVLTYSGTPANDKMDTLANACYVV